MAKKGSKFNKHSSEFKIMVVEDYLSGKNGGYKTLIKKHGMKSTKQLRDWISKFKQNPELLALNGGGRPKRLS